MVLLGADVVKVTAGSGSCDGGDEAQSVEVQDSHHRHRCGRDNVSKGLKEPGIAILDIAVADDQIELVGEQRNEDEGSLYYTQELQVRRF